MVFLYLVFLYDIDLSSDDVECVRELLTVVLVDLFLSHHLGLRSYTSALGFSDSQAGIGGPKRFSDLVLLGLLGSVVIIMDG